MFDIVVVGAGPAGLAAAKTAAENGMSVALLERKDTVHEILRMCGMMLVTLSGQYMGERVVHNPNAGLICFPHNGFDMRYDGPTKDFFSWILYSPNQETIAYGDYEVNIKKGKQGRASAVYDKSWFLRGLLQECKQLGVKIFSGENVISVNKEGERVCVYTASGKCFKGIFAIAADGRQSRVARSMGMNTNRSFFCSVTSVGYEMTNLDLPQPHALHMPLVQSGNPPMLGFIIPRARDYEGEDVWLVMITNVNPRADHEAILEHFMHKSSFAPWFKHARKTRKCGCAGNVYEPIYYPYKDNVLFAGNAGWCQEAEMTGAVMSGWKAACAAVFALLEGQYSKEGVQSYLDWWKEYYIDKLDHTVFLKNLYMPIICTDEEIDYLFSKVQNALPTVLDPYVVPEELGVALSKIMPEIKRERPKLLQKILDFSSLPPEVALRETIRVGYNCKK